MATNSNLPATAQQTQPLRAENTNHSERFMKKVIGEFAGSVGDIQITEAQRRLIQGYFIGVDRALKDTEAERIRKNGSNRDHSYDNNIPCDWNHVNLRDLALDVVHYARLDIDMMQANFISPIPFVNKKGKFYDINLMLGYNGIKYIAERYALTPPKSVTIELVYKNDKFTPYKKGRGNSIEGYEFDIPNPFDRGEIIGGFGYIEFNDPSKNELVIMSMKDIEKRKPKYASVNFWGDGTVKEWQTIDGKRQQVDVPVDGWKDEMCRKTLIREVYSPKHILLDPRKIDENYQYMKQREAQFEAAMDGMRQTITVAANTVPIDEAAPQLPAPAPQAPPALPEKTDWAMPSRQPFTSAREIAEPAAARQTPPATAAKPTGQADIFGQGNDVPFPDDDDALAGLKF